MIETLKRVESDGIDEVILYFNVGRKPHGMVKDQMHKFIEEVAPAFEGSHARRRGVTARSEFHLERSRPMIPPGGGMRDHSVVVDEASTPRGVEFADVFNVSVAFLDRHLDEGRGDKPFLVTAAPHGPSPESPSA